MLLNELKYPIGTYEKPIAFTAEIRASQIETIQLFPIRLKVAVNPLTDQQLDTPYRPEGWTIRQLVHHCADSHMNSFIRFKLALTEEEPTIKTYIENRWAELLDSKIFPIESSLLILEGLHERWTVMLKHLTETELHKVYVNPEKGVIYSLEETISIYAWHCNHHLAHVLKLKEKMEWDS